MSDIINLDDHRPHRSGQAKCTNCKHVWAAVSPVGCDDLECPECGLCRGVWYGNHLYPQGTHIVTCSCGNTFFEVSPEQVLCINCGNKIDRDEI